jgi:hypothetical protein
MCWTSEEPLLDSDLFAFADQTGIDPDCKGATVLIKYSINDLKPGLDTVVCVSFRHCLVPIIYLPLNNKLPSLPTAPHDCRILVPFQIPRQILYRHSVLWQVDGLQR